MNGLGGLNTSPNGAVIGRVQLQLADVFTRADLAVQTDKVVAMAGKAKRGMPALDRVAFPGCELYGLSKAAE